MLGIANHVYTAIIRDEGDRWNKWFVSYSEWPRNEVTAKQRPVFTH